MASSDIHSNDKNYEQVPIGFPPVNASGRGSKPSNSPSMDPESDTKNGQTVKLAPPSSGNNTKSANKRKRESVAANININKEKESKEKHVPTVETAGVKDVEMKDAENIDGSFEQRIKEVEMQDAEVAYNKTDVQEKSKKEDKTHSAIDNDDTGLMNLNAPEGCKQDQGIKIKENEKPTKVDVSKSNEKKSNNADVNDGSGQHVLGEVATLLKQVQESDAKAKLEVEVKVKKMDHGDVKENDEIGETQPAENDEISETQPASRVSCP